MKEHTNSHKLLSIKRVLSFHHTRELFHGLDVTNCDPASIEPHTRLVPIDAEHVDALSQRTDTECVHRIDELPAKGSDDPCWNDSTRRWQVNPQLLARQKARRQLIAQIASLELEVLRALCEYARGDVAAIDRLDARDQEIATLRAKLGE
jgi:hypothetical protein